MKKYVINFSKDILGEDVAFAITVECDNDNLAEDIRLTLAKKYEMFAGIVSVK